MKPKLILLNGTPGMGKTTLAQRYVDEHPLTLNLDVDSIWHMLGQWQQARPKSDELKLKYSYQLASMHLDEGLDVIVPNLFKNIRPYRKFVAIAEAAGAALSEIALVTDADSALGRFVDRGKSMGYADGFRPGGVMDTGGREQVLIDMHSGMLGVIALRPNVVRIEPVPGDIEGAYQQLLAAIIEE